MARIMVRPQLKKTRKVNEIYFRCVQASGCPHCKSAVETVLKGKGIKPSKSQENFAGLFAMCKNPECSFRTEERYYYVSKENERVDENKPNMAAA